MWCYQKPGYEAVVLTELQRQQQCSQFCDTLLKAGGVSVPAHSCILSAISPRIFSALSNAPAPPAGQSHLLEFRDLGACTLLHLVRLLYSGEMVGEGESEKQEAVAAAAKLGIHGLVEVTRSKSRGGRGEGGGVGQYSEVGVQTEPVITDENEGRLGGWRREVRNGMAFLWKDQLSNGGKDMWTQTEELHLSPAPPAHPVASYETIDISTLQSLGETDSHQFVPVTLVYPPNENQTLHPFSSSVSVEVSTEAGNTSVAVVAPPYASATPSRSHFYSQNPSCAADPHSCWAGSHGAGRDVAVAEEWEDERLQDEFQGNIPGFISYFLNPENKEGTRRGRAGRRQRARGGGGRRSGTRGEQRARAPRGRGGARGRGGLTQMVDVQEVGLSKLQKLFLHRWGMRTPRTGQGGGAVGRKLYVKSREVQKAASRSGRRRRGKVWEVSQSGDVLLCSAGGGAQRGRKNSATQFNQTSLPVGRTQKGRGQSTPVSFSGPHRHFHDTHALSASSPSLQPSPCHNLLSPPASFVSPASSLVYTTPLPPPTPAPPPQEEHPECIDRLLEEFIIGLNILPNNTASPSQCPALTDRDTSAQNKQQSLTLTEAPVRQQQSEGDLNEILDQIFQSFEQQVESSSVSEENEMNDESSTEASQPRTVSEKYKRARVRTRTPHTAHPQCKHALHQVSRSHTSEPQNDDSGSSQNHSETLKSSACSDSAKHASETTEKAKRQYKRRSKSYLFSLEKRVKKARREVSSDDANIKLGHNQKDLQLQLTPVVKLDMLPSPATLQENQSPSKTTAGLSSAKKSFNNKQEMYWTKKVYPIRSRFREANITDTTPFLKEHLPDNQPPSVANPTGRRRGSPKTKELNSSSNGESSEAPAQTQPVDSCGADDQSEKNQERHEDDSTVQPQEEVEGPAGRGKKRAAECDEDANDDATVTKRISLCQMTKPACETCTPCSESADDLVSTPATTELEEGIDVHSVSLTHLEGCAQGGRLNEKFVTSEIKQRETEEGLPDEEMESSADELIHVEEYQGGSQIRGHEEVEKGRCQSRTTPAPSHINNVKNSASHTKEHSLPRTGKGEEDKDEEIDVTGGSTPVPDPVIISWTESSEGEEEEEDEDIDVVGEKTDLTSSLMFTTMNKGELVNGQHQMEVLSH